MLEPTMCTIILKETLNLARIICPLKISQYLLQEAELFDLMVLLLQTNLIMALNCLGQHSQSGFHFLFCLSVTGDTNICNNCPHLQPRCASFEQL